MRRLIIICALLWSLGAHAWSEADDARWHRLNQELRCLVCQNQSIADSNAELAQDLRGQVKEMMIAGQTDDQIRLYMTERYGDFVLYRPPFKRQTWLLWLGPFLMLGLGLVIAWRIARGRAEGAKDEPVAVNDLDRILNEVERD